MPEIPIVPDSSLKDRSIRVISHLTILLVVLLAVASFTLSYEALAELAQRSGAISAGKSWVFPLCVDGSIVVFSIAALRATITGERGMWPLALVITTTLASIALNIAHAPGGFASCLVGAMPPLLLFLAFESLMRQVASNLRPTEVTRRQPKRVAPPRVIATIAPVSQVSPDDRLERARDMLQRGSSKRAVSKELRMAVSTVRRIAASVQPKSSLA